MFVNFSLELGRNDFDFTFSTMVVLNYTPHDNVRKQNKYHHWECICSPRAYLPPFVGSFPCRHCDLWYLRRCVGSSWIYFWFQSLVPAWRPILWLGVPSCLPSSQYSLPSTAREFKHYFMRNYSEVNHFYNYSVRQILPNLDPCSAFLVLKQEEILICHVCYDWVCDKGSIASSLSEIWNSLGKNT